MRFLLTASATTLLLMSASASAWWDNNYDRGNRSNHWNNNGYHDGRYDGSGATSGDGSVQADIQFDMKLRGDADGYVYGNLGNGWDNVYIEQYSNDANGSNYSRYYRNGRQSDYRGRPYYGPGHNPYYRPGYGARPPAR